MLDFNTSPQNDAGNFLFGDMSLASKTRYNLQQAAAVGSDLALDPSSVRVVKDANGNDTVPAIGNPDSNYWNKVANSPEYAKALYEAHIKTSDPSAIGQPMTVRMKDPNTGILSVAQIENTGVVRLRQFAPDEVRQMEADVQNQKANEAHLGAVKVLNDSVNTGISALELAAADSAKSSKDVVTATKKFGEVARPVYQSQAEMLAGVADQIVAAGNVRAGLVEGQRAALAQPEILAKADKILNASLDFVMKSNADRDKAKAQLDEVMANPFFRGASVVYGGDDKNPIISSAKATFETAQDAAAKSQQIANSVMTGIDQYQKIAEKQFLVKTPVEVKAEAAQAAANVRIEGNKATLSGAGTNVTEANAQANSDAAIFGDKYKILHEKISGLTALVQATSGVEKQALQVQLMESNRQMRQMIEDGKNARAEMKALNGAITPEITATYDAWGKLNRISSDDPKSVIAFGNQSVKAKDKEFEMVSMLSNSKVSPVTKMEIMNQLVMSGKDVEGAYPGASLTVAPGENGYAIYLNARGIRQQITEGLRAKQGDKFNEAKDLPAVEVATSRALVASFAAPENPIVAEIEGAKIPISLPSPAKVFPGKFLPLAGTATGGENKTGLPDVIYNRLLESQLAQAMAKQESSFQNSPADVAGKLTVGYKDAFTLASTIRAADPSYTVEEAAAEIRDIYGAGVYLNNKYTNGKYFGLPEQTSYVIEVAKESVGKSAMTYLAGVAGQLEPVNIVNRVGKEVFGADPAITNPVARLLGGNPDAARTNLAFRKDYQNPFSAVRALEKQDLLKPVEIMTYLKQINPTLWAARKVSE